MIDLLSKIFGPTTWGGIFTLGAYLAIDKWIPKLLDSISTKRKAAIDAAGEAKAEERAILLQMNERLAELNGHTKCAELHTTRDELFKYFVTEHSCGLKGKAVMEKFGAIEGQYNTILQHLLNMKQGA